MKQNNYEHIAIFDASVSNAANERLNAKRQRNKHHQLLTYSSVAAVIAFALLSSAIFLPFMKQHDNDSEIYALGEKKISVKEDVSQVNSTQDSKKLAGDSDLLQYYGLEIEHRSNEEQEQAILSLLQQANKAQSSNSEEVLKFKELENVNSIKFVGKLSTREKQAVQSSKTTRASVTKQTIATPTKVSVMKNSSQSLPLAPVQTTSISKPEITTLTSESPQKTTVSSSVKQATKSNFSNTKLEADEFAEELTDKELMYYIVMAETGYADSESISLVAQIIVNRTKVLGQSLRTVLVAPGQFSCYEDGTYRRYAPTARVKQICDAALNGAPHGRFVLPRDTIFYCTVNYYLTKPPFFTGLKRILTHNSQVFFAQASSNASALDDWKMPEPEPKPTEELVDDEPQGTALIEQGTEEFSNIIDS